MNVVEHEAPAELGELDEARAGRVRALTIGLFFVRSGPLAALVVLFVAMTLASPYFLTENNLRNLGGTTSVIAALGVGQLVVMLTRGIDLSVGAVVALSSVTGALVASALSAGAFVVIVVALLAGLVVGTVNGVTFVYGRVPHPFVVTLATLGIVQGVALLISNGTTVTDIPSFIVTIGNGSVGPVPVDVIVALAVAVIAAYLLRTRWGRCVYAVGGNPEGAAKVGVPVRRVLLFAYMFCGMTAAVGGVISMGRTASASPLTGVNLELDAITAVIIGGASFFGGRGTVANVVIGALILETIRNGLNLLGVNPFWQYVAGGTAILLAVELDVLRGYLENRLRVDRSVQD